jgi:DNA-binding transcriptional LysR family regulator
MQLRDAVKAQWILPNREAVFRQALEMALAESGLHLPDCALECSAFALNETLVRHTDALCPVPQSIARRLRDHPQLCTLPAFLTIAMPPVVMWTRHVPPYRPSLQKFIYAATDAARRLGDDLPVSPMSHALPPRRQHIDAGGDASARAYS